MSALLHPKKPVIIGISDHIPYRLFAFGYGVLLVIHWSAKEARYGHLAYTLPGTTPLGSDATYLAISPGEVTDTRSNPGWVTT